MFLGASMMVHAGSVKTISNDYAEAFNPYGTNKNADGVVCTADVDGDGRLEVLRYNQNQLLWYNVDGEAVITSTMTGNAKHYMHDLNNDGIPDMFFYTRKPKQVAYSTPTGYVEQDSKITNYINEGMTAFADFNRDGRVDIFGYQKESGTNTYTPYLCLQRPDGTFLQEPFPIETDAAKVREAMYAAGGDGSFTVPNSTNFSGVSLAKKPARHAPDKRGVAQSTAAAIPSASGWQIVDMNLDGYPDMISEDGLSYISLSNGMYYPAAIAGKIAVCDFNQDGIQDLVIFDSSLGNVDLMMSTENTMVTRTLYNHSSISDIICQDMNNDGLADVLLLATAGDYQYFLFFKNNGDGTFKTIERYLTGRFEYKGIYDFHLNGCPSLVMMRPSNYYINNVDEDTYKIIHWDSNFTLTETDLFTDVPAGHTYTPLNEELYFAEYLGDGKLYLPIQDNGGNGNLVKCFYTPMESNNTSPAVPIQPAAIADNTTGLVKVEWQNGTDTETSACDLDYEVMISKLDTADNAIPLQRNMPQQINAEPITITFSTAGITDGTLLSDVSQMGTDAVTYVASAAIERVYPGKNGGVRLGASKNAGSLTLTLKEIINATSIKVTTYPWKSGEGGYIIQCLSSSNVSYLEETVTLTGGDTELNTHTFSLTDANVQQLSFTSNGRFEIASIIIYTAETEGGDTGGDTGSGDTSGGDEENTTPYIPVSHQVLTTTSGIHSGIFNMGTWAAGDYYAYVRSIDANGNKSAWSEGAKFTNHSRAAEFSLSANTLALVDTLVVSSFLGDSLSIQALPDGRVIENKDGVAKIVFADMGTKTIIASIDGGISTEQSAYVEPFKVEQAQEYKTGLAYIFDLNNDGKLEYFGESSNPGLYTLDKGVSTLVPSLSSSDISARDVMLADHNRDGLPDLQGKAYGHSGIFKNTTAYGLLINNGDLSFTATKGFYGPNQAELYIDAPVDMNNDGVLDYFGYVYDRGYTYGIYTSDSENTVQRHSDPFEGKNVTILAVGDFNNDGYLDAIGGWQETNNNGWVTDASYMAYINKGNYAFEAITLPIPKQYNAGTGNEYPILAEATVMDVNQDGYVDLVYSTVVNSPLPCNILLGDKDNPLTQTFVAPHTGRPMGDLDNDGMLDYYMGDYQLLLSRKGENDTVSLSEDFPLNNCNWIRAFDYDEDGYPDVSNNVVRTTYSNTAPTAPTTVYAEQTTDEIIVHWEGASDKESQLSQLRYNLSVREKGTNKYIISPLNATKNEALTIYPGYEHYRTATTYPIPITAFTAGKTYEICVQTIDPCYAQSDFIQVIEFTTAAQLLIYLPAKGGVDVPVTFSYAGNTATPTIVADGGGVVSGNTITWNSVGTKTVTAIAGDIVTTQTIVIVEKPDLTLKLPEMVFAGAELVAELPIVEQGKLSVSAAGVLVEQRDGKIQASIPALADGEETATHTFVVTYQDEIFGTLTEETPLVAVENIQPEIRMLTVESNAVRITWDANETLTALHDGKLRIYRETNIADKYDLIATVDYNTGTYLDETAQPDVRSARYVLALTTTDGAEGICSTHHTSIHTMINQGMGNNVNLHWTHYEGAPVAQYTILSGTSPDNLTILDNISGNAQSYTHKRASDADTYYALAYTLKSAMAAPSIVHRAPVATLEGRSNVICSNEAYNVTPVESISISSREGKMVLTNGTPQLHLLATVTPVRATLGRVAWSVISGEDYAAISSDGVLTLVATESASGTITVQAKAVDGSEVTATANIAFAYTASTAIAVTGVSLDVNGLTLNVGDVHTLTATVAPENATNKTVTWGSSDASVVSVQNGVLTAVATGSAVVSVTTVDGGFHAECVVTVQNMTAVEDVEADSSEDVRKVLEDGVIYIIRNGERYMIDGRKVE